MDTSELYVKMCKQAVEIQQNWKPQFGDYCMVYGKGTPSILAIVTDGENFIKEWGVWLPRQDQLQEMEQGETGDDQVENLAACISVLEGFNWYLEENWDNFGYWQPYRSMEQLWLVYLYAEKYSKVWDSEKQEWRKEE